MSELKPAGVFLRVKAATLDAIFIMMILYTVSFIFGQFNDVNEITRGIVFVVVFVLYEPILLAFLARV